MTPGGGPACAIQLRAHSLPPDRQCAMLLRHLRQSAIIGWRRKQQPTGCALAPSTIQLPLTPTRSPSSFGRAFDFHFQAHQSALSTIGALVEFGTAALAAAVVAASRKLSLAVLQQHPDTIADRWAIERSCKRQLLPTRALLLHTCDSFDSKMLNGAKILSGTDVAK